MRQRCVGLHGGDSDFVKTRDIAPIEWNYANFANGAFFWTNILKRRRNNSKQLGDPTREDVLGWGSNVGSWTPQRFRDSRVLDTR